MEFPVYEWDVRELTKIRSND